MLSLSCLVVDSPGLLDRTGPVSYLAGTFGIGAVGLHFIKAESGSCSTDLTEISRDAVGILTSSEQDPVSLQTFTISKLLCYYHRLSVNWTSSCSIQCLITFVFICKAAQRNVFTKYFEISTRALPSVRRKGTSRISADRGGSGGGAQTPVHSRTAQQLRTAASAS
jgi:hypothetical protein